MFENLIGLAQRQIAVGKSFHLFVVGQSVISVGGSYSVGGGIGSSSESSIKPVISALSRRRTR